MVQDKQQSGDKKAEAYVEVNRDRIGKLRLLGDNLDGVNPAPVAYIVFELEEEGRYGGEMYEVIVGVHSVSEFLIAPLYAYSDVSTFVYAVPVSSRIRDPQGFLVSQAHILQAAIEKQLSEFRLEAVKAKARLARMGSLGHLGGDLDLDQIVNLMSVTFLTSLGEEMDDVDELGFPYRP